ncbi:MAG: ABC transporter substrate-binding protein [Longimicrobiales bacterium]|nr:ABC transporter substrate-binding protein [Longimicrobiales bacterium]
MQVPAKKALVIVGLLSAGACTEDAALTVLPPGEPFCARVLPAVDAFLEAGRSRDPVQGDAPYGGSVVIGGLGEIPNGMMSTATSDYVAGQHQQFVNLMTLIDYDEDFQPRPYLAESWEVAPDGTALTFHLRDDVFWHDGERTDAHDVAFTYRRVTDPAAGFPNAAFWDHYLPGDEGVEVLDERTVRFRLAPHGDFLDPWRSVAILPEHLLGDVPPGELRGHPYATRCPVGNGPFVFLEHREQEVWRFAANPSFPEALGGRPYLDGYVYRVIPDENTLLLELLSGGVDVFISPQPDQADAILADPDLELLRYPFRNVTFVAWNARRPQLADARVRRAITLATGREEIVQVLLQGYGSVADGTVPPWHWAFDPEVGAMPHDPEAARRLLDGAGWRDRDGDGVREDASGRPLSLSLKTNQGNRRLQRLGTIMQAHLREVGVELRLELMEWSALVAQLTDTEGRDYDGVVLSWVTEFKLDDTDLFHSQRVDRPYAFSGTRDARLDAFLDSLPLVTDRARAREMWRAYQARLAEVHPFTFFYFPDRLDGVNRRVQGVEMDARGEWVNLKEWRVTAPAR